MLHCCLTEPAEDMGGEGAMDTKAGTDLVVERIFTPSEFEAVKEIYRSHKATLGFLPDGAFAERFAVRYGAKDSPGSLRRLHAKSNRSVDATSRP